MNKVDHDILLEVHASLYGVNGQGGLMREVTKIELGLFGNPDAISHEDKQGIAGTLRTHIKEHKAGQKRNLAILTALAATLSTLVGELLRRLGILG